MTEQFYQNYTKFKTTVSKYWYELNSEKLILASRQVDHFTLVLI